MSARKQRGRDLAALALIAVLVFGAGCVAMQSAAPPTPVPPATQPTPVPPTTTTSRPPDGLPPAQVGTTASGGSISVNGSLADSIAPIPVARDSTPTADAIAVLNSIPDPLGRKTREPEPGARSTDATTPSPRPVTPTAPAVTPATVPDTSVASTPVQADTAGVPTPEPTQPLGDRPGSRMTIPDSLLTPATGTSAPAQPSGAAAQPAPSAAVSRDSCWRVQFAAKPERARSERLMAAARSQLDLPMVIVNEKGLYKVRTRDCMSEGAAEALKKRAIAAGFDGAFKLRNP